MEEETQYSPCWKFLPTDEELVLYFLKNKAEGLPLPDDAVRELDDFYQHHPALLSNLYIMGVKEVYFLTKRSGDHPNLNGDDKSWESIAPTASITNDGAVIGYMDTLKFHEGGRPTSYILHEYRLQREPKECSIDEYWVLCKLYNEASEGQGVIMQRMFVALEFRRKRKLMVERNLV